MCGRTSFVFYSICVCMILHACVYTQDFVFYGDSTMRASLSLRRAFSSCSSRLVLWSTTVLPADPADDCREEWIRKTEISAAVVLVIIAAHSNASSQMLEVFLYFKPFVSFKLFVSYRNSMILHLLRLLESLFQLSRVFLQLLLQLVNLRLKLGLLLFARPLQGFECPVFLVYLDLLFVQIGAGSLQIVMATAKLLKKSNQR